MADDTYTRNLENLLPTLSVKIQKAKNVMYDS
jgi:hypothetical protein